MWHSGPEPTARVRGRRHTMPGDPPAPAKGGERKQFAGCTFSGDGQNSSSLNSPDWAAPDDGGEFPQRGNFVGIEPVALQRRARPPAASILSSDRGESNRTGRDTSSAGSTSAAARPERPAKSEPASPGSRRTCSVVCGFSSSSWAMIAWTESACGRKSSACSQSVNACVRSSAAGRQ